MTIDELAQEAGLTVRNVRSYQSRGLIPPPQVQGRVGYYGPHHLAELQLIREMQAQGFNLTAIAHLLEQASGAEEQVLGFTRSLMAPFETETPEMVDRDGLVERLGGELDSGLLTRACKLNLVVPVGEGSYEVPSPTLLAAGERLVSLGVPLGAALEATAKLRRQTERIAEVFVQLFLSYIWEPFDAAERPEGDWPRVQQALDQLRPLASEAVTAAFQQTMTGAVEAAFGRRLDQRPAQRGRGGAKPGRDARA
ncbi:MAG TPA: MerR family transcriptional regulator [Solirubrobacteraceae bacterium]|nr:MerR family transcriptional regulator [Solirubrobacteraceae bacterium]